MLNRVCLFDTSLLQELDVLHAEVVSNTLFLLAVGLLTPDCLEKTQLLRFEVSHSVDCLLDDRL